MFSRIRNIIKEYKKIKYLAYHDSLTGLLNRNWLYENINDINYIYVYFIDINNLHEINKQGHTIGDEYIKNIVSGLVNKGLLVRYAGDEFILFSNFENIIQNNNLYSVGYSKVYKEVFNNVLMAINEADINMLKNKTKNKSR